MYCSSNGIKLGVFSDEDCTDFISDKSFEDASGMAMDEDLLSPLHEDSVSSCSPTLDATQQDWYIDGINADADEDNNDGGYEEAVEYCQNLFDAGALCDPSSEDVVTVRTCSFVNAILKGEQVEGGDIVLNNSDFSSTSVLGGATGSQKVALGLFVPLSVGLAIYACFLFGKASEDKAKTSLSSRGGAMA